MRRFYSIWKSHLWIGHISDTICSRLIQKIINTAAMLREVLSGLRLSWHIYIYIYYFFCMFLSLLLISETAYWQPRNAFYCLKHYSPLFLFFYFASVYSTNQNIFPQFSALKNLAPRDVTGGLGECLLVATPCLLVVIPALQCSLNAPRLN